MADDWPKGYSRRACAFTGLKMYHSAVEDYAKVAELDPTPAAQVCPLGPSLSVLHIPEPLPPSLQTNLESARSTAAQSPHTLEAEREWFFNAQREETKAALTRRGCAIM